MLTFSVARVSLYGDEPTRKRTHHCLDLGRGKTWILIHDTYLRAVCSAFFFLADKDLQMFWSNVWWDEENTAGNPKCVNDAIWTLINIWDCPGVYEHGKPYRPFTSELSNHRLPWPHRGRGGPVFSLLDDQLFLKSQLNCEIFPSTRLPNKTKIANHAGEIFIKLQKRQPRKTLFSLKSWHVFHNYYLETIHSHF